MIKRRKKTGAILIGVILAIVVGVSIGVIALNLVPNTSSIESQKFTITWKNYDGAVLEVDNDVPYGTIPIYDGDTPIKNGNAQYYYTFSGWSPNLVTVTENTTYTAQFVNATNLYTITWKNYDGAVLEVDNDVPYGTIPIYDGDTPIRIDDSDFGYIFGGWSPTVVPVASDKAYTAVFQELNKSDPFVHGLYPQTKVADDNLIITLNDFAGTLPTSADSQSWTPYNYYISGSNTTKFMWYQDISVGEDLYRGVYFTSYRPYYTASASSTSNSFQDDNGYLVDTRYWFKFEPILWDVLSVNELEGPLMLSSKVIDSQEYYHSSEERSISGQTVYPNNYKESNIRKWLNGNFLNTAFLSSERNLIKIADVDNSAFSTGHDSNLYATTSTNDKLFLPSYREVTNAHYGFSTSLDSHVSRVRSATDYAKSMGVYIESLSGNSSWWLRSPFDGHSRGVKRTSYDGEVSTYYYADYTISGVLPAFRINR